MTIPRSNSFRLAEEFGYLQLQLWLQLLRVAEAARSRQSSSSSYPSAGDQKIKVSRQLEKLQVVGLKKLRKLVDGAPANVRRTSELKLTAPELSRQLELQ